MTFNNSELNQKIGDIYQSIKDNQEVEAWNNDSIEPVEVNFTWYDNGLDEDGKELIGYAIDFGDYYTALYTSIDEAQADFDLLQKKWKKKKIYVLYMDSSDDQPMENVAALHGHAKNKEVLVNLAINEIKRSAETHDWEAVGELLGFLPKKYLKGFLSEDKACKLGLL